jgi:hypothetical protein
MIHLEKVKFTETSAQNVVRRNMSSTQAFSLCWRWFDELRLKEIINHIARVI